MSPHCVPRYVPRRPTFAHLRLGSIEEIPEYDLKPLNLGVETPRSGLSGYSTPASDARQAIFEWSQSTTGLSPAPLLRNRSWRSSALNRVTSQDALDSTCGIWCVASIFSITRHSS